MGLTILLMNHLACFHNEHSLLRDGWIKFLSIVGNDFMHGIIARHGSIVIYKDNIQANNCPFL